MKILIKCPYCGEIEFAVEKGMFVCETCGEYLDVEGCGFKKLEEN